MDKSKERTIDEYYFDLYSANSKVEKLKLELEDAINDSQFRERIFFQSVLERIKPIVDSPKKKNYIFRSGGQVFEVTYDPEGEDLFDTILDIENVEIPDLDELAERIELQEGIPLEE